MRFSDLNGKEIIDVNSGERLGVVGNIDLVINPDTGKIEALLLPQGSLFILGKQKEEIYISWKSIRKIGSDMIIVEKKDQIKSQ